MSHASTLKLGTKRKKQSLDLNVKTTLKIPGTLHKYFTPEKIMNSPSEDDVDKSNQNQNQELNATNKSKSLDSKIQIIKVSPPSFDKLWPCFIRVKPVKNDTSKKIEDEDKLKAKSLFLESGAPTIILKKKIKIEEDDIVLDKAVPFPLISHVTQIETSDYDKEASLPLPLTICSPPLISPIWKTTTTYQLIEPEIEVFHRTGNPKIILDQLKEEYPKTDVKTLFRTLKMYKSSNVSNLWTEVYKPLKILDVLGNSEQIYKLRTWLDDLKKKKTAESESSGDEFVRESDEEANNFSQNVAVITGPCGSGKTSAVFAVANQLDCKVLEINTSNNRSGKRILAEFLESTQSHHVERVNTIEELSGAKPAKSRKRKRLRKEEHKKMEKTSLILVEEADIVFPDIDEGFTQALFSLASSSKRPLILITNSTRHSHLERFNNSQSLEVCFSRPRFEKLALWLRMLGLVEGIVITRAQAARLVQWARGDVRRCLLQLQIMLLSNNSEVQERPSAADLWWNWPLTQGLDYKLPTLLRLESDSQTATQGRSKAELLERLQLTVSATSHLACLDLLTRHGPLGGEPPCPASWEARIEDSVSLTERCENIDDRCLEELADWFLRAKRGDLSETIRCQTPCETKWLSVLRQGEHLYLSGVPWSQLTARDSLACDYMTTLRALGRCDQVRLPVFTRRTSRLFNYLQGLGIHASKSFNDFMCDAFS